MSTPQGTTPRRFFTAGHADPFDGISWDRRTVVIKGEDGKPVFEQHDVEVPSDWSVVAGQVVASKYFRGKPDTLERENSVRQLVRRVVRTITSWGSSNGYFANGAHAVDFESELTYLLVHQYAAFNSPVWFNVGVEKHPQCSACFINNVTDDMGSILDLAKTEGMLFKYGSGAGSNLSRLRGSVEHLRGGGLASGPVSFMRGLDAFAGAIKSGGKTRRAAKMVILDADHPDILQFIRCKAEEEKKAWALIEAGYNGGFNVPGGAYDSVGFQNANHSVRVTDEFMQATRQYGQNTWPLRARTDGSVTATLSAELLFEEIAKAAHLCGDPGMQFDTTINRWHTCPNTDRIHASNPCSEYMFLNDSACNLASLNLLKFWSPESGFNVEAFEHAVDVVLLAMEIIVGFSSYPTPAIAQNSHDYRPLGLGYANLGALLMANGLPYDSHVGRRYAAAVTSLMCGRAYAQSAKLAQLHGAFEGYDKNAKPMLGVVRQHANHSAHAAQGALHVARIFNAANEAWAMALHLGERHGFRNSQVTVLAPTGTIGFMMDCDTTGIEPDIALVKHKKLVGGGTLKLVNGTVPRALVRLGYTPEQVQAILAHIEKTDTIEGAPHLAEEHLAVFDCAFKPLNGQRTISWEGHIHMMAAVQPFLSGAISKTVNMPADATVEDMKRAYFLSWEMGLKAVALYRDGCKRSQPLSTGAKQGPAPLVPEVVRAPTEHRRRLPTTRKSLTHKFRVGEHEGYLTVGMYEDGQPGELFVVMAKEGSVVSGLMDSWATALSLALQYGVPLQVLVDKFSHTRFEPSGWTGNEDIPMAKSVADYIARWLEMTFLAAPVPQAMPEAHPAPEAAPVPTQAPRAAFLNQADAPPCSNCGQVMVRNGSCYKCLECGSTSGCS